MRLQFVKHAHTCYQLFTQNDVDKTLKTVDSILSDTKKEWNARVTAVSPSHHYNNSVIGLFHTITLNLFLQLRELRSVIKNETTEHAHFLSVLKTMDTSLMTSVCEIHIFVIYTTCINFSLLIHLCTYTHTHTDTRTQHTHTHTQYCLSQLKDLRSQVVREACVTLSFISTVCGLDFAPFAELVFPPLINLLSNSAKVMASSADVCLKMIIKVRIFGRIHPLPQPLKPSIYDRAYA